MSWKRKTNNNFPNLGNIEKRRRAVSVLLAWQIGTLGVGAAAVALDKTEDHPVQVDSVGSLEASQAVPLQVPVETVSLLPEPAPQKEVILKRLGDKGLELVRDENNVTKPSEFMATADGNCTTKFSLEAVSRNAVRVVTLLIGPRPAMTDPEIVALDGTEKGQTIHAESTYNLGEILPIVGDDVGHIISYLRDTTDFYCDVYARSLEQ